MTTAASPDTTPIPLAVGERAWLRPLKALISYGILFLLAAMFIYPFLLAISTSFKTLPEINQNPIGLIPQTFTLEGYQRLFSFNVGRWTFNSALVATIITVLNLFFASLAGFGDLISTVYPVFGYLGALSLALVFWNWRYYRRRERQSGEKSLDEGART